MVKKMLSCFLFLVLLLAVSVIATAAASPDELGAQLQSETAILIDGDTGQILFEKEMHQQMYPASITKILTALLALESGNLSDTITMSHDAVFSIGLGTSHVALDVDETLTLENALYALALASANDAANGIAEHIGGTMENFASMMTNRAKEAGALHTNFINAHGLHDENHYTTAYDMARIAMAALKNPKFAEIFSTLLYEMPPTNKQPEKRIFRCTNAMLVGKYKYEGIIAEKTGWTEKAKHTLVTVAKRDGRTLIAVVMKSPKKNDQWIDTTALLDYGFDEFAEVRFAPEELSQENYVVANPANNETKANLSAANGFRCLIPNVFTKDDIEIKYFGTENESQAKAVFSLRIADAMPWITELGELKMQAEVIPIRAPEKKQAMGHQEDKPSMLPWVLGILGMLLAVLLFLLIRRYVIMKRHSKRRVVAYAMIPMKKKFRKRY